MKFLSLYNQQNNKYMAIRFLPAASFMIKKFVKNQMTEEETTQAIILATANVGKIKEFSTILAPVQDEKKGKVSTAVTLITQQELGIESAPENGLTFVENAISKARYVCERAHKNCNLQAPTIADDSGLVVSALNGAPGIFSARYAAMEGTPSCAADNIKKLLHEMRDIPETHRNAYFYCVIVYLRHATDPTPIICQGKWEGKILTIPQGANGFGYDPIFWVPTHHCSAATLPAAIKNQISHRAQALQQLVKMLQK